MKDLKDFLDMGGYAAFVWSAYGLVSGDRAEHLLGPAPVGAFA